MKWLFTIVPVVIVSMVVSIVATGVAGIPNPGASAGAQEPARASSTPSTPPEIPFESVPNFFKYPFEMNLGEMGSVAVNARGHVFMLSRSNVTGPLFGSIATQVLEFDQNGRYVREWGKNLYGFGYAHSIRFDKDDNMWVVDKGTNMIIRFNQEGHVTMVLGRKEEAADEHHYPSLQGAQRPPQVDNYFNQPTDIAWDKDGNAYVSDGYVNSRVAKIDRNGDWVKAWGIRGAEPGQFNTPHNIGIDREGNVYVADRGNARIQVFDLDGAYKRTLKISLPAPPSARFTLGNTPPAPPATGTMAAGAPWTICITQGSTQYLYTNDAFPGRFYKIRLPEGTVVGMFGSGGRQLGQFNWNHGIACPSENELYVADLNNWRVQKLILHPERMKSTAAAAGPPPAPAAQSAERAVRAAEEQFNDARAHADVATLGRLLADDWTITHGDGTTDTKSKYLADLKSGARTFASVSENKVSVRLHGDSAVVSGVSDSTVQYNGQPQGGALYFTRVYVDRNGTWQMIVSHATRRPI